MTFDGEHHLFGAIMVTKVAAHDFKDLVKDHDDFGNSEENIMILNTGFQNSM